VAIVTITVATIIATIAITTDIITTTAVTIIVTATGTMSMMAPRLRRRRRCHLGHFAVLSQ
jgi:hypothetical protein